MSILKSNIKIISKLYIEFQRINSTGLSFITSINKEPKLYSDFFKFEIKKKNYMFFVHNLKIEKKLQMSLWGATVITNLLSAIPVVGQDLVELIWTIIQIWI